MRLARYIICGAALFLGTVNAWGRDVYELNSGWTFFFGNQVSTDNAAVVNLPHTWNATFAENFFRGEGNYLKTIDIPAEWRSRRVFLRVGGAATVADVFANSRHVATHKGGSSAFAMELTDYLQFGQSNTLRVVVSNAPRLDVMPTAGEENIYGGLFRGAELIVCEPFGISPAVYGTDGISVETTALSREKASGTVRLRLLGASPGAASGMAVGSGVGAAAGVSVAPQTTVDSLSINSARVRFLDAEGVAVVCDSLSISELTGGDGAIELPFEIPEPHLWQGTADPYLYNMEVKLTRANGSTADSMVVRTGFRTIAISNDNKLLLNDIPVRIKGVIVHRDWAMTGTALGGFQIEEDVALIREMGANAVRVAGGQHSRHFYDLCDAAGLLVWNDLPFTGAAYPTDIDFIDTEDFKSNGKEQLREMITGLDLHPSVVIWGLFSGVVTTAGDDPVPYIRELNALAHQLDTQRLTAGSSRRDGEINTITDLISFELPFGWESGPPDGVGPWLRELAKNWGHLRTGISYGAPGSIFQRSERLQKPDIHSGNHPENWQTFVHREYLRLAVDAPELWGVFVANMFDFGAARTPDGGSKGGLSIDERGLVTFDRKYRKAAFRLYKDAWATDK